MAGPEMSLFYDVRPGHIRKVTGELAAIGPTRWLVVDCRKGQRCANTVVDPDSGAQRALTGLPLAPESTPGVIAPDGSTAAAVQTVGDRVTLRLVDLDSGAEQTIAVPLGPASPFGATLAWSPDSRWLFVVTAQGGLAAVDMRTHRVEGLGAPLPPLSQIAVQPVPS